MITGSTGLSSFFRADARTKALIWQGSARATLTEKTIPEEQPRRIDRVIAELLKTFPPEKTR
jgi:hypothetical protein